MTASALRDSCVHQEPLCFCEVPTQPESEQEHCTGRCETLLGCSKVPLGLAVCSQACMKKKNRACTHALLAWQV